MHAESKKSIQRKAITAILLVGIIPSLIVVVLTYLTSINALKNSIGTNFQELATETADKIQIFMNMTIKNAKSLALAPVIVDAVSRTNRSYTDKDRGLKHAPIIGLDLQRPFSVSEYMKDYQRQRMGEYGSILVTDSKGYVVKAINGPAERYHGEKDWWRAAYNQGRGQDYIGGIEYDKDAQTYSLAIAVPVHSKGEQKVIGVLKMTYSVKEIFNAVNMIKIGKTGHANLVTSDGMLVVCPIYPPESHRINDRLMRQISTGKPGWGIADDDAHGGKDSIIGFAPVASTLRAGAGYFGTKAWYIFIRQFPDETYAPMHALLWKV
ncbi:MAG: cache domain-containing protein, partial [Deltaproteobacteria bacterium]